MAQPNVKRGSVVLVRYPFTDLTGMKIRPAVILTPDQLMSKLDDVLCMFVSSSIPTDLLLTDFILDAEHPAFAKTGLRYRSIFRCHKLTLLHKHLVLRVLGELDESLMNQINLRLQVALGLRAFV